MIIKASEFGQKSPSGRPELKFPKKTIAVIGALLSVAAAEPASCGAKAKTVAGDSYHAGQIAGRVGVAAGKVGGGILEQSGQGIVKSGHCKFVECHGTPTNNAGGDTGNVASKILSTLENDNGYSEVIVGSGSEPTSVVSGSCSYDLSVRTDNGKIVWSATNRIYSDKPFIPVDGSPNATTLLGKDPC